MAKIDINGDGKADFSINIGQVVMLVSLVVSMAGSYYNLNAKIEEVATLARKTSHNQQEYCFPNTRAVEDEIEQLKIDQREFQTELRFILNNE